MNRRHLHQFGLWACGLAVLGQLQVAVAQGARPLNILVGFPPGGTPDLVARAVESVLRPAFNPVVANKTGAGGRIAIDALMAAPADAATTLILPSGALTLYPHVFKKLRYDSQRDVVPLASACSFAFALAVGAAVPASVKTLQDFLVWIKANPARAQYGTPGVGGTPQFIGVQLADAAKIPLTHVPYKGGQPAIADTVGGTIAAVVTTLPALMPLHKSGKLRVLAHSGTDRLQGLPDVPTFKEQGFADLSHSEMFLFIARAGAPQADSDRLAGELRKALDTPAVQAVLAQAGLQSLSLTTEALSARVQAETRTWGAIVKASGFRPEE